MMLRFCAEIKENLDAWGYSQTTPFIENSVRTCYVHIFPQFRTKTSLFEPVVSSEFPVLSVPTGTLRIKIAELSVPVGTMGIAFRV